MSEHIDTLQMLLDDAKRLLNELLLAGMLVQFFRVVEKLFARNTVNIRRKYFVRCFVIHPDLVV